MRYEVWLGINDPDKGLEVCLPFEKREEAEFVLNAILSFRQDKDVGWALNDLEEGCNED